ncbi:MAG TPA: hypothetical protein VGL56_14360 [Fimbriimonadaceae bacterium]|jgi:hypothetical protein
MWDHHRRAVDRWVEHAQQIPDFLAVIVAGSLTKGYGLETSDVDGFIIVSEEEFARRKQTGELFFFNTDLCDYEGGYIDAKCVAPSFLEAVKERGSEPARSAFIGAEVPWSRISGLPELCLEILKYPEAGREYRMSRFVSQIKFAEFFAREAEKRGNPYLMNLAASKIVLFCGRLLLTHNRILYPYHKWLLRALADCPLKPEGIMELLDAFSRAPSAASASALAEVVLNYHPWPQAEFWPNQVIRDSEWNWLDHEAPIEDI